MEIKCKCGCNPKFEENDKYGRPRKYLVGHGVLTLIAIYFNPNHFI